MSDKPGLFEELYKITCEFARKEFLRDGLLRNQVLLGWDSGQKGIMVLDEFEGKTSLMRAGLQKAISKLHEEGAKGQPDYFIQLSEAWMAFRSIDDLEVPKKRMPKNEGVMPRNDPDRKEVIIIAGGHRDGRHYSEMSMIYRDPSLHLGDPEHAQDESRSRIADLLWGEEEHKETGKMVANMIATVIGENPSDEDCIRLAAGILKAMSIELPEGVSPNIRNALSRAADLLKEITDPS